MKSAKPSTRTLKRSRGEAYTIAPTSGIMPVIEETSVDPITAVDPSSGADGVDPTVDPPLSPRAMMQSFMTTQVAHGQLLDELLTEGCILESRFY